MTTWLSSQSMDLVALDDALKELAKLDPQQSRIVELRFFGGLSIEETADAMDLSPTTVKRHWRRPSFGWHHEISKARSRRRSVAGHQFQEFLQQRSNLLPALRVMLSSPC